MLWKTLKDSAMQFVTESLKVTVFSLQLWWSLFFVKLQAFIENDRFGRLRLRNWKKLMARIKLILIRSVAANWKYKNMSWSNRNFHAWKVTLKYLVRRKAVKLNPLSAKLTKWPNPLKQFVGKLPTNCLSVFDHFVGLRLKG